MAKVAVHHGPVGVKRLQDADPLLSISLREQLNAYMLKRGYLPFFGESVEHRVIHEKTRRYVYPNGVIGYVPVNSDVDALKSRCDVSCLNSALGVMINPNNEQKKPYWTSAAESFFRISADLSTQVARITGNELLLVLPPHMIIEYTQATLYRYPEMIGNCQFSEGIRIINGQFVGVHKTTAKCTPVALRTGNNNPSFFIGNEWIPPIGVNFSGDTGDTITQFNARISCFDLRTLPEWQVGGRVQVRVTSKATDIIERATSPFSF